MCYLFISAKYYRSPLLPCLLSTKLGNIILFVAASVIRRGEGTSVNKKNSYVGKGELISEK